MAKTEDEAKTTSPRKDAETQGSMEAGKTAETSEAGASGAQAKADGQPADAVALLKQDHRTVDALFTQYERADEGKKPDLIKRICTELTVHTLLEEEIFYPACRQAAGEDQLEEAQVEHDSAKVLLIELSDPRGDTYRDAKVKVLAELIRTHVREEEAPDGIFAKAQKAGINTADLAQRLSQRKQALLEQVRRDGPPPPRTISFRHTISDNPEQEENMRQPANSRDERGRFTSDDDRSEGRRSSASSRYEGSSRSRDDDDDDRRYSSRSRSRDDDDRPGWRGDPEGHSEAARRGWEERRSFGGRDDDDDRRYSSRGRDDDDRGRGRSASGGDRDRGGWFGDPEGHSEAARRGWEERERGSSTRSRSRDDDDDRRYSSRGRDDDDGRRSSSRGRDDDDGRRTSARSRDDDDGRRSTSRGRDEDDDRRYSSRSRDDRGGWFGDPEGHSEAARRGWEERERGASTRSRSRDDDDDDRRGGRSRGGWFGDPEGHSEAARRGWEERR